MCNQIVIGSSSSREHLNVSCGDPWSRVARWHMCIFYSHLVYFKAIWYISRPFGIFHGHLVHFTAFWFISQPLGILSSILYIYCHFVYIFTGNYVSRLFCVFTAIWEIFEFILFIVNWLYQEKSGNLALKHFLQPRNEVTRFDCPFSDRWFEQGDQGPM
jgi:hypothetical protein